MQYEIEKGKKTILIDGKEFSIKLNGRTPEEMTPEDIKKSKQFKTMTMLGFTPVGKNLRLWIKEDLAVWLKNSKVDRIRDACGITTNKIVGEC